MDNPVNQFIEIAADSPTQVALVPQAKNGKLTIACIEYELLGKQPYQYTLQELKFATYLARNDIPSAQLKSQRELLWEACFAKPYACMRASPLTKQYGWGAHYDEHGKIAIYTKQSEQYAQFCADTALVKFAAMRSKRA